jgi:Protein of unknown function (DUF3048) N-terminal domain/Protein of unknown function (DUF3048) C-terminal domain
VAGTAAAVALLTLAGCGGSDALPSTLPTVSSSVSPSTSGSASTSPSSTVAPAGYAPYTGLPVATAAALSRSAVAVVVQMVPGHSVSGVGVADLVYAEFDRPGHVRLLAVYQSTDAASVGPVTATAPDDPRLLTLFTSPAYAFNGGPTGFVVQAKAPAVVARDAAGSYRSLYRVGSGGLVVSTVTLRASVRGAAAPMGGALTFASDAAPAPTGAKALTHLVVSVPGQSALAWTWTSKGWAGPAGSLVANVVVQYVPYKSLTPHKSPTVGSADTVGTGPAAVYAGQHGASVVWTRRFPGVVTVYTAGPQPVGLLPGRTWVLLVPKGTRVTSS